MERSVVKACQECAQPLHFVVTQARCINSKCPLYWKGQGSIETLEPLEQPQQPSQPNAAVVILPPEELA